MITFTETMIKISEIQENYSGGQKILNAVIQIFVLYISCPWFLLCINLCI